jgi:hypothetical protein
MSQRPNDLALAPGLIRKGEARGLHPEVAALAPPPVAAPSQPEPAPPKTTQRASSLAAAPRPASGRKPVPMAALEDDADEPPLRAAPPDDVPKRFTSFRLPVELDEFLRAMVFETRQSKQDLLTQAVTELVARWKRERARRAG